MTDEIGAEHSEGALIEECVCEWRAKKLWVPSIKLYDHLQDQRNFTKFSKFRQSKLYGNVRPFTRFCEGRGNNKNRFGRKEDQEEHAKGNLNKRSKYPDLQDHVQQGCSWSKVYCIPVWLVVPFDTRF